MVRNKAFTLKIFVVLIIILSIFLMVACGGSAKEDNNSSDNPQDIEEIIPPMQDELTQEEMIVEVLKNNGEYIDGEYTLIINTNVSSGGTIYSSISLDEETGTIITSTSSMSGSHKMEALLYLYKNRDFGVVIANLYNSANISVFMGIGYVTYRGFMNSNNFLFSDVFGDTAISLSFATLTQTSLQTSLLIIDNELQKYNANIDFIGTYFK